MDTVYKILENCEVKKVGGRQYEFTASTADMDRDGEVIDVTGWDLKNFKKNPVIMFAHDYRTLPIGKATKIGVRDGKLMNVVEFPPEGTYEFADTVQRLVDAGYLKTESVGFIPKKWEDGDGGEKAPRRTYTKQELLEISIVPVPSNPNALMNAVKEGVITQKQFKSITELEEKETPKPAKTSQEQIIDELDYIESMLQENGANDEAKEILKRITESYLDAIQDATTPVENIVPCEQMDSETDSAFIKTLDEIIKEQLEVK